MTTAEKRLEKARLLKEYREASLGYKSYAQKNQEQQDKINEAEEKRKSRDVSVIEKVGVTALDTVTELLGGLGKLVEGVVDAGVGIAGGVGGIFGADTDWAEDIIKFDATQEWYYDTFEDELTRNSYINDAPIVKDVVRGIGQQLPTIALIVAAPFTGGATLAGVPYTVGATIASAGGSGMEEALNEDAEFGEAFAYGALQAGIEGVVEMATSGMGKGITSIGKSIGKNAGKSVAKTVGRTMLEEGISEGVEEGLSALLNPLTKTTYKGTEALEAYNDMTFYLDAGKQALVGGVVGGITGGSSAVVYRNMAGGASTYSIQQSVQELDTLKIKENNLWKNGKLSSKKIEQLESLRQTELKNISSNLQLLSNEDKKSAIEKYGLDRFFNEDGTIITQNNVESAELTNINRKPISTDNIEAYSPSLRNEVLEFAPTNNLLSDQAKKAKNFITALNPNANIVVSDSMPNNVNAFYDTKSKIFYFSNSVTEETVAGHEFTHSLEGTKEYETLANYILDNVENLEDRIKKKIKQYQNVNQEAKQGENGKMVAEYEAQTEIVAEEMGKLLSNPEAIQRIVNQNKSLIHKIIQWIKDVLAKLTKSGARGEYYNFIRNAEKLYADAIRTSIGGIALTDVAVFEELEKLVKQESEAQSIAKTEEKSYNKPRYSIKSSYSQYRTTAMIWANETKTKAGDLKVLYNPQTDTFNLLEADGSGDFVVLKRNKNYRIVENLYEELINEQGSNFEFNESVKEFEESVRRSGSLDLWGTENNEAGNTIGRQTESESNNEGVGNTKTNTGNSRYTLKDNTVLVAEEIKTRFGTGYSVENIDVNNYNLIKFIDNEWLGRFNSALNKIDRAIVTNDIFNNSIELSYELFTILSKQEGRVYSKLGEINKALANTQNKYNSDHNIDITKTFIQELGYNGILVQPNQLRLRSVIYDTNIKRKNLLDFSPARAKERLDKAIQIFGETDNPAKAGWLLSDGRFVNYNRDSVNILKETSDDFILDYKDHFEIEKVYDTKRGFDAIDSFMAEGNIRLMPEIGGIEIRNNLQEKQVKSLTKYIDTLIDKKGIRIDFRPVNTTDNILQNYVYYSPDMLFSAKTIIGDINTYYRNGQVPRVIDGKRYSLTQEDIESLPGELKDGIIKELNKENITLGELYEYGNGESGRGFPFGSERGEIRERDNVISRDRRKRYLHASECIRKISSKHELNGDKEAVKFVEDIIKNNKLYNEYDIRRITFNRDGFSDKIKIVNSNVLPKQLQEIRKENSEMGIITAFYIVDEFDLHNEVKGFLPIDKKSNRIFLQLGEKSSNFVNWNRHEKTHYYQNNYPELYKLFVNEIDKTVSQKQLKTLFNSYSNLYEKHYKKSSDYEQDIWNEVYAQIYALNELADNLEVYEVIEKFDQEIKEHFKLSHDVRYSLKDGNSKYDYSKGQIAKYVAEHSKLKAYSRSEAEQAINTIVANQLSYGSKYGEISGKTKEQVINALWHAFNTKDEGYRSEIALDIADYIINNAVMEDIYQNDLYEYDSFIVSELRKYLHNIDLSSIKGEIKHHYDTDNSPYLIWGKKTGTKGLSADQIAQVLKESGLNIEAQTEADIFFEIDSLYRNSLKNLKKAVKQKLTEIASKQEISDLKQNIAKDILNSFDENGHKTRFAETIEKYTNKINNLKQKIKEINEYNKAEKNLTSTISRLKDMFVQNKPAGWEIPEQIVKFVKDITKVKSWKDNIVKTAREHISKLQSKIDLVLDDTQKSIYPYREVIAEIAGGDGVLSTQEVNMVNAIFNQFIWQLKNYDNVEFEGKTQSNTELAIQGVRETKQAKPYIKDGTKLGARFKHHVYSNPYDRLSEIGLYRENSITMRFYRDMLDGDRRRAKLLKDVSDLFDEFFKKNKNYLKELQQEIKIGDISISKRQALSIYCTSLREQGRSHLFNLTQDSGVIHLLDDKLSIKGKTREAFQKGQDIQISTDMINEIKKSLTDADKEYLKLVDKFFNKISKDAKKITDEKLYGITNIEEGYYFPIKVSNDKIYTKAGLDDRNINQYILDMGMNKSTKPNANNKIVIDGIESIVASHLHNLSLYYGYSIPLTAYNRIMNKQVETLDGSVDITSNMRAEIQKIDPYFEEYMNKLWRDIQGIITAEKGFLSDVMSYIRWATANSALGLSPKVLFTQTLSLAAAVSEFNPKYVAKGIGHFFGEKEKIELSKYSPLMWERMEIGNSVDIAEIREMSKSKISKTINNITTKPISWMDSNVIRSLWFAAQYEVADTKGLKFGTEANKVEAGRRLDEVVFRTQQTSDPLGRSEWMRSQNELVKFVRMFTGDAIQLTGRLISSVDKYNIAKKMIKSDDVEISKTGQKLLAIAKTDLVKAGSAFILNQVMLLAIAMAFKWLKGKDDDEEWGEVAKKEATANLMGLLPFGGDIYDKLSGYEPTNMAYTALSNSVDVVSDLTTGIADLIKGDYESETKRRAIFRKSLLSISRLLGVPLQNLESYTKGIVGHVSPKTREEYEALFKTKSNVQYLNKIRKATEDGNEELAESIINIMFDSRTGKIKDDKVLDITRELLEQGYDVIPKSVGKTITYDSVEYTLTDKQHKQFTKIYSQANESVKKMINTKTFSDIDDEAKAKAMNFIYSYYYNLAIEDMLGEDLEIKNLLFAQAVPIEQLAMAVSQAQVYTSDVDKSGKVISGTKKSKIQMFIQSLGLTATQKYMIMGYLGYTNKYGSSVVKTYINKLSLSKTQKQYLFELSGYGN